MIIKCDYLIGPITTEKKSNKIEKKMMIIR